MVADATSSSLSTASSFDVSSALLAIAIENKEMNNDLFVSMTDMSLEFSIEALDDGRDARKDSKDAAFSEAMKSGATMGGQALSAMSNAGASYRMRGGYNASRASKEFDTGIKTKQAEIGRLETRQQTMATQKVEVDASVSPDSHALKQTTTGPEGEQGTVKKDLKDVTPEEYDAMVAKRDGLKNELENDVNGLTPDQRFNKQQQLDSVQRDIKAYDKFQGDKDKIGTLRSQMDNDIANETRRQFEQTVATGRAVSQSVEMVAGVVSTAFGYEQRIDEADAAWKSTQQAWSNRVSEAISQLASQFLTNRNEAGQLAEQGIQEQRSGIQRLTQM